MGTRNLSKVMFLCIGMFVFGISFSGTVSAVGTATPDTKRPTSRIAYVLESGIYVINDDGSELRQVSMAGGIDGDPAWSPDGRYLAYTSNNYPGFYVLEDEKTKRYLYYQDSQFQPPRWSPDSKRLVFICYPGEKSQVCIINVDGTGYTQLTNTITDKCCASWSPRGEKILFASNRDGNYDIYTMDTRGQQETRLTTNRGLDTEPAWSPDGQKIAFASSRTDNPLSSIYVMNADGSSEIRLTNNLNNRNESQPVWSPDGKHIAYLAEDSTGKHIHYMNADGSNIIECGFTDYFAWSPDGKRLAFVSMSAEAIFIIDIEAVRNSNQCTDSYAKRIPAKKGQLQGEYFFGSIDWSPPAK